MSSSTAEPGVLLTEDAGACWAWYGVNVTAATDLSRLQRFRSIGQEAVQHELLVADQDYLGAQLGDDAYLELRWTVRPGSAPRLDVLGRLRAANRGAALEHAVAARDRLLQVPDHVAARPIISTDELRQTLGPFEPLHGAALRKRWIVERPQRDDAHVRFQLPLYVSSPWLREVPTASWAAVIAALARQTTPMVLSIGLEPVTIHPAFTEAISRRAAIYSTLGERGQAPSVGLYSDPVELLPDPGALTAGRLFTDAVQRYHGRAFSAHVQIAAGGRVPPGLLTQVRQTMSPTEGGDGAGHRVAQLVGSGLEEVQCQTQDELSDVEANLSTLAHLRWGPPPAPPEALSEVRALAPLGHLVDIREASALFRFPAAPGGVLEGFPVVRPAERGRVTAPPTPEDASGKPVRLINLGRQPGASEDLSVKVEALSAHTLVVGSTGSGKTNSVLSMLLQLWGEHRIPFLVIEPVNAERDDYRWLMERPGFEEMTVFTIGDESVAPFRLNPFEVPEHVRIGTHLASLVSCFDAAFGLTGPLPFLYRKALKNMYTGKGISPDEVSGPRHVGRWPRLRDLVDVFAALPDIDRYAGEVKSNVSAASRLRTESLLSGSCGRTLDADSSFPIDELLSRPAVLELAAVGDDDREQALMIALLLNAMTAHYKATRKTGALAHVTVIEEAHRLLRRPRPSSGEGGDQSARAAEQFANTLAENRKYGEGLIVVEQVPSKLIEDALKNTATKVMHHLPAVDDRETVSATMNLSDDQVEHAKALDPMTAYVTHRGTGGRSGLVEVVDVRGVAARAQRREEEPLPGTDVVRRRFGEFVRRQPRVWDDLAPYADCEPCRSRCRFRGIGEVTGQARGDEERARLGATGYPKDPNERDRLWERVRSEYDSLADEYQEFPAEERVDLSACIFMHSARAAFPQQSIASSMRLFREASPTGARGGAGEAESL